MSAHCCPPPKPPAPGSPPANYRRILWVALIINFGMFVIEVISGLHSASVSLLADALDFFGDAANYGISLWVLGMQPRFRAAAAMLKAASMALFGLWVLGSTLTHFFSGVIPAATTMSLIGVLALLANLGVAWLLYATRHGDSNMRSVWLCTRNDAIGNVAVILAAVGVLGTGAAWPDLLVASLIASLALHSAWQVIVQARNEYHHH